MLCALPVPEAKNPAVRLREGCEALCAVLATSAFRPSAFRAQAVV